MMEWSLSELYPSFDSPQYQEDMKKLETQINAFNEWSEKALTDYNDASAKAEEGIKQTMVIAELYDKLASFAQLTMSVEAQNEDAAKAADKVHTIVASMALGDTRFKKWLAGITNLDSVINESSLLKEHEYFIKDAVRYAKRLLSEQEEQLISQMQTTGSLAWSRLQGSLTSKLLVDITVDGKEQKLPLTVVRNMAFHENRNVRRTAYEAELRGYEKIDEGVAASLNGIKGEFLTISEKRGYRDPLEATLETMKMDRSVFDTLMDVMKESLPIFRRYLKIKAQLLGDGDGLPWYDLFAPVGKSNRTFTINDAKDYIVSNFAKFAPELSNLARQAFEEKWIDYTPREGKRGGAFCSGIHPIKQSRIMANFDGTFDGVTSLSHELGHAFHNWCQRDESILNADSPMPLAETASTFNETMIAEIAMSEADNDEKLFILEKSLSGDTQVVVDILSRFLFESEVFQRRSQGPLSVSELKEIMANAQEQAYGDGLNWDYLHPYMWVNKPHYYYANLHFYNFPYAFGQLFSKALYAMYKEQGKDFLPAYENLLRNTGKHDIKDLGSLIGVNLTDKKFWEKSIALIEEEVNEFERLANQ
ncbi:M3 family oligoendopeptidase [Coprothermobacter platensis]|uniref:M3 family oligoendopeptidase n=1 Tax=Coprothermobacter platensis TaxID=108819 RepID=UPI00035F6E2A|nr:M3 family oligoendopeptidase [Coprothermobacter platensis]